MWRSIATRESGALLKTFTLAELLPYSFGPENLK